ncbi:hypothetical protein ACRAWC_10665 [Leifsonia sp. L25]|uniref:hypothetical protein n=1 Tax=Actinomycetes TaxID=1760 RepID=UPI003D6861D6
MGSQQSSGPGAHPNRHRTAALPARAGALVAFAVLSVVAGVLASAGVTPLSRWWRLG